VGGDPVVQPVVDGPQVQGGLHGPERPLGLEEVLVAECDVLGGQVGVGGGEQVLAVQVRFDLDLGVVDRQTAGRGVLLEPPAQGRVVAERALGLAVRGIRWLGRSRLAVLGGFGSGPVEVGGAGGRAIETGGWRRLRPATDLSRWR
jgi:hypothetical protein